MRITGNICLLLLAYICCIATVKSRFHGRHGYLKHQWKKHDVHYEDSKLVVNPTRNATHLRIITECGNILFSVDNTNTTSTDINTLLIAVSSIRVHYSTLNCSNYHIVKHPYGNGLKIKIHNELNTMIFEKQFHGSSGGLNDVDDKCVHLSGFNLILEPGLDVNHRDGYNMTSLMWAAFFGNEETTKYLVEKGANVNTPGLHEFTPLTAAILSGNSNLVEYLIKHGARVNEFVPEIRMSLLHIAIHFGHLKIVQILLDNGANLSRFDFVNGETPLHYAIAKQYIDLAKELIARGSDVNAKAGFGITPLHIAIKIKNEELIHLLLQKGADVNSRAMGLTPIMVAILHIKDEDFCLQIVKHLIEHYNPDVNITNNDGKTALSLASEKAFSKVESYLKVHGAI